MTPNLRQSVAAFALIRRDKRGLTLWLAQWNPHWQCHNFVGGHKRDDEPFRECVVREVAEELRLQEGRDFIVAREPMVRLEYTDWSESAQEETEYTVELFEVRLPDSARRLVDANPDNCWISAAEIRRGHTTAGRRISATVKRLLEHIERSGPSP
jgi:8-oxo-dGTP pyrophosphatase MutT (NUDIX family)